MFSKKGVIAVAKDAADEEKLMNIVLEPAAKTSTTKAITGRSSPIPADYEAVAQAVQATPRSKPRCRDHHGRLDLHQARRCGRLAVIRLLEALEDLDDMQNVYSNFDMDAKQLEEVAG